MKVILFSLLTLIFSTSLLAADDDGLTVVAVGEAGLEKSQILFDRPRTKAGMSTTQMNMAREIVSILRNDFSFYKKNYSVIAPKKTFKRVGESPDYKYWSKEGLHYIADILVTPSKMGVSYNVTFHSVLKGEQLYSVKGVATIGNIRKVVHNTADQIYRAITGKESIFNSKIVFVSDRTSPSKKRVRKELYIMDFDGQGVRRLTAHNGTVISPAISYDGKKILYSLIKEGVRRRNVNLYVYDLKTGSSKLISSRRGINSGAIFLPDGKHIMLTMTHSGNAEIYKMHLTTRKLTKVTNHYAIDVDPSISRDGKLMSMLSGRSGKAMIYTLNPKGVEKNVTRISYVGKFNATPRFSPDGKEIVFASWLDNRFDLFRIDSNGLNLSRLTKNFGSNEDPTYSNDGQFIAFTSKRVISKYKAVQNIYIMDRDGEILGNITKKFGNCISPRWSKF